MFVQWDTACPIMSHFHFDIELQDAKTKPAELNHCNRPPPVRCFAVSSLTPHGRLSDHFTSLGQIPAVLVSSNEVKDLV